MTSPLPSGDPSSAPEETREETHEFGLAAVVQTRGAALVDALERHLPGAREHAEATASYAFAAAVALGHDRTHSELVREAAKLHDVGKVYVPFELLTSDPDELTEEDAPRIAAHFEAGYRLVRGTGIPEEICTWILRMRERFDGHGPEQLAGEAIPVEARIARAACACDAVIASRPFNDSDASLSERRAKAIAELRTHAGVELDPSVVEALAAILDRPG